jgi:hypothetical protein
MYAADELLEPTVYTAELLVPDPSFNEVKIAVKQLVKKHYCPYL